MIESVCLFRRHRTISCDHDISKTISYRYYKFSMYYAQELNSIHAIFSMNSSVRFGTQSTRIKTKLRKILVIALPISFSIKKVCGARSSTVDFLIEEERFQLIWTALLSFNELIHIFRNIRRWKMDGLSKMKIHKLINYLRWYKSLFQNIWNTEFI